MEELLPSLSCAKNRKAAKLLRDIAEDVLYTAGRLDHDIEGLALNFSIDMGYV